MEQSKKKQYVKRTQKDYSMSFKLQVVWAAERGEWNFKTRIFIGTVSSKITCDERTN